MDGAAVAGLGAALGVVAVAGPGGRGDRRADRTAGLDVARRALRAAGGDGLGVVGHHDDGRPCWPDGWTGSIAHTDTCAVAAVSATHQPPAIGIDVEHRRGLTLDEAELVLGPDELAVAAGSGDPSDIATLLWSAKEAAFKAWSTLAGGLTGVDPVDIRIDLGDGGANQNNAAFFMPKDCMGILTELVPERGPELPPA